MRVSVGEAKAGAEGMGEVGVRVGMRLRLRLRARVGATVIGAVKQAMEKDSSFPEIQNRSERLALILALNLSLTLTLALDLTCYHGMPLTQALTSPFFMASLAASTKFPPSVLALSTPINARASSSDLM